LLQLQSGGKLLEAGESDGRDGGADRVVARS